jgi:DNA-binding XRE family transcriptional regulator
VNTAETMSSVRELDLPNQVIALALPILVERVAKLSRPDRDVLFSLIKELPSATDREDFEGICHTILEIIDAKPGTLERVELDKPRQTPPKLGRWLDFVGTKVREMRAKKEWTQADLAERAKLPQSHISRIESGKVSPSSQTIEKIAKALGLPLTTFYDVDC